MLLQVTWQDITTILNRERTWVMHAKRVVAGMAHLGFVATVGESLTLSVLSQWDQQKPVNVSIVDWLYHQGGLPEY